MKFLREHIFFILVLGSATVLRLWPLFNYQFTYDEISGLERTQFNSLGELIQKGIQVDAHPALVQVFLYYAVKIVGFESWLLKLPFILCSLASIWLAYLIGLNHFSKRVGQFFSAFLAYSLIFVFYAPIARMYAIGVFFSLGLLYFLLQIVKQQKLGFRSYLALALLAWLSALNHHMNALFACSALAGGLFLIQKEQVKNYLIMCTGVLLAYSPHLPITLHQLGLAGIGADQQGWLDAPQWNAFYNFFKVVFGTGYLLFVVMAFILITVAANKQFKFSKIQYFLVLVFVFNYLLIYLYSVLRAPIYQNSVMLFSGTALLLVVCSCFESNEVYVSQFALLLISALLIYQTYFVKNYFHQAIQNNYEVEFERAWYYKNKFGANQVSALFLDADPIMKNIYFKKYGAFDCVISTDSVARSLPLLSAYLSQSTSEYLVVGAPYPLHNALAQHYYPYLIEKIQQHNVRCFVYAKTKHSGSVIKGDSILFSSYFKQPRPFNYLVEQSGIKNGDSSQIYIDTLNEFPFAAKAFYHQVFGAEGQMLLVKAKYKLYSSPTDIQTCISVQEAETKKNLAYTAGSSKQFLMQVDSTTLVYAQYFAGSKHRIISETSSLACYLWNSSKSKARLLDFKIEGIDFWPERWHFWD